MSKKYGIFTANKTEEGGKANATSLIKLYACSPSFLFYAKANLYSYILEIKKIFSISLQFEND